MEYFKSNIISIVCIILMLILSLYLLFIDGFVNPLKDFPQGENHIAIVLDVSQSMNIIDMQGESRLIAAKKHILSQIQELAGYQFSLTIFAGESQNILPFTNDISLFATFLSGLDYRNITEQGTNINSALKDSSELFLDGMTGDIFLYTDGDDTEISINQELKDLLDEKSLVTHIIPVGSHEGGYIPSGSPLNPYKVYNGELVKVGVNTYELESLAVKLAGVYHDFTHENILQSVKSSRGQNNIPIVVLLITLIWGVFLGAFYLQVYFRAGK